MKKKWISLICVLSALCILISGAFICYANTGPYLPTTPLYDTLNNMLFTLGRTFTTGNNNYFQNDNYKYYYWCDFTPQYGADYTVTVTTPKRMKIELYDSDNNFISRVDAPEEKDENNKFVFSLTHRLEERETYYYKFAYTNGYFNSCGPFFVQLSSGGGDLIPNDEYLHLFIDGMRNGKVYDMYNYSQNLMISQLSFKAVHKDGRLHTWSFEESGIFYLDGCDILMNLGDCQKTVGKHTLEVHYMGYKTAATFIIVECLHEYEESSIFPTWLEKGCTKYVCKKCGDSYFADYYENGQGMCSEFIGKLNSISGDDNYDVHYDLNKDGIINARDYKFLLDMYENANRELKERLNTSLDDEAYLSVYDMDNDGVINDTDYTMLLNSKS